MKEATGELNMTVVTVVAIAAVAAFFYAFVWPGIRRSIASSQVCSNSPGSIVGVAGQEGYVSCSEMDDNKYTCQYYDSNDGKEYTATCTARQ